MNDWIIFWDEKLADYLYFSTINHIGEANNNKKKIIGNVCSRLPKLNKPEYIKWFEQKLKQDDSRWFVADIFTKTKNMPLELFKPFIEAALDEKNPSKNKFFIEPCVYSFEKERVTALLHEYSHNGTSEQKIAVEKALYWVDKYSLI